MATANSQNLPELFRPDVCPGLTATYPGAEEMGARPIEESAPGVVWAAKLPDDGPTGGFFRDGEPLPW